MEEDGLDGWLAEPADAAGARTEDIAAGAEACCGGFAAFAELLLAGQPASAKTMKESAGSAKTGVPALRKPMENKMLFRFDIDDRRWS